MSSNRIAACLALSCAPLINFVNKFRADKTGVAAIEFAFIAPLMFFMLVGTVEMAQAITVDRRVTLVASSTADLVAREKAVTTADIETIFQIISVLFAPYDTAPLKITLLEVGAKVDDETKTKMCWQKQYQGGVTTYALNADYALPAGIVEKGGSVIVAEVSYTYTPLIFSYFIGAAFPMKDKFYLKPRVSSSIDFDGKKRDAADTCNWPP
jgi:Flp pilus assembly protein TadG